MTALDDAYASDPTSPESEAVWGDPWQMDPERHTPTDRWAAPFADIEDDWALWP